ncbi:META domain-containing protein [Colwellia sp. E2M01]|uniref:META domain-containing protein n=1 Tax=Colwellia sp. E2M01 TaxID=2841561 RepID=UPI001C09F47E|nr:META domain-containing protein [Colwellia sp. E2M01]MBU2871498.1 META domain-containing protein [Colwellia sp. E2M01]
MKNYRRKFTTKNFLLGATFSILLTACSNPSPVLPEPETLAGYWLVESINDESVIKDSKVDLIFTAENQLSGTSSCNNFSTSYSQENNSLTLGNMATTRKMCLPALMEQETTVLHALSKVKRFQLSNGQLSLFDQQGVLQIQAKRTK